MDVPPIAFIMGCALPRVVGPVRPLRVVGISPRTLLPVVTRPRTLLKISSAWKNLPGSLVIHVPASMPATLSPARASGSTATPPAAPRPTTTTSTGLLLMAIGNEFNDSPGLEQLRPRSDRGLPSP